MNKLRSRKLVINDHLTIEVVESVGFWHEKTEHGGLLYGNIKPVSVVVYSAGAQYEFDIQDNT